MGLAQTTTPDTSLEPQRGEPAIPLPDRSRSRSAARPADAEAASSRARQRRLMAAAAAAPPIALEDGSAAPQAAVPAPILRRMRAAHPRVPIVVAPEIVEAALGAGRRRRVRQQEAPLALMPPEDSSGGAPLQEAQLPRPARRRLAGKQPRPAGMAPAAPKAKAAPARGRYGPGMGSY